MAATPFVVLVIALDAADNVLVVAPDRIEAVLLRAITPEVGFATRTESEATPLCSPDSAKVLAAVVVIDVAPVNVPPSLTSFPVKVKPLEAVVLSSFVNVTVALVTPLTVVVNDLVDATNVLETELTI